MTRTVLLSLAGAAFAAAFVVPAAAFDGEWRAAAVFSIGTATYGLIALLARRLPIGDKRDASISRRLSLVAVCWVAVAAACAVLTWVAVHASGDGAGALALRDPMSAIFETVSGASSTGLTMLDDPSLAEPWLQWWRTVLQYLGSLGVILFAVTLAEPSGDHDALVGAEWGESPGESARQTICRLSAIIGILTAACGIGLLLSGDPPWRALNHAMSAAATGGFVITSNSAAASAAFGQIVIAITLIVSAMSFGTLWDVAHRRGAPLWKRTQVRFGWSFTVLGVGAALAVGVGEAPVGSLVFNSISASTTGGFAIGDSFSTVTAIGAIAMMSMFIGSASGSTGGGVKVARIAWLVKAASRWIPGHSDVDDDRPYTWDGEDVEVKLARHRAMGAGALVAVWLATMAIGSVVVAVANRGSPLGDVIFDSLSAGLGIGMSSGLTDELNNAATKSTLVVLMMAGRVEVTAFIVLLFRPLIDSGGKQE